MRYHGITFKQWPITHTRLIGIFFRGCHDNAWRARWQDAMTVTNALTDEMQSKVLPDSTTLVQAFARAFYGVGFEIVPLAQSC